jgi:hypothetical protein
MALAKPCFFCEAPSDPTVPSIVAYCTACWATEHLNVKARQEADYHWGLAFDEAIAAQVQRLREKRVI